MSDLLLQLFASAAWDLCRLSWSPPLRGTFVASVGPLRYVEPLLLQLVACAMWDLGCLGYETIDVFVIWEIGRLSWTLPLQEIWVAPTSYLCYVES